jgi:exopolyphosphatase/guanosine-5'-triphosphate,3'-diphosphate pyrophosphatase
MRVAAIDIGTNSTRVYVAESGANGLIELERITTVTGLGRGATETGVLTQDAIDRTCAALGTYAELLERLAVTSIRAVATAAARRAPNREVFLDAAERALGVRPEVVSGPEEARLAFAGAARIAVDPGRVLVVDIGGGSTEFVTGSGAASVPIGSVVLSESELPDHPTSLGQLFAAAEHARAVLAGLPVPDQPVEAIGVAGTWTSISGIIQRLPHYDRSRVHGSRLSQLDVDRLVVALGALDLEATAAIPSLDPARAPVILGGAIVARECMQRLEIPSILISEWDLLDGVAAGLIGM